MVSDTRNMGMTEINEKRGCHVSIESTDVWVLHDLPRLNRAILVDGAEPAILTQTLRDVVLPPLVAPSCLPPGDAQQLLVHLGLVGASVARHHQERRPDGKATPERAFDGLLVGSEQIPFRTYFAELADRTGTGHCGRDSYASLVRWNVGTIEVRLDGEVLAVLPGVFDDGRIRTYTGTAAEERFFALVKKSEAVELAVNRQLEPLTGPGVRLDDADAVQRVRTATVLLDALRRLFVNFAALPPERSMPPDHFLDVFRQFAVHWTVDDVPPSGALDSESLKRDFLLGLALPDYAGHVRRLFPALLADERAELEHLMTQPTLPQRLAAALGTDLATLPDADPPTLRRLVDRHPVLADWYGLLAVHARAAAAHLMLSKKFLFRPQSRRDAAGLGDRPLVSNRRGTTGMTETFLERLTTARREHVLAPLRAAVKGETAENAPPRAVRSAAGAAERVEVALTG
jgi:hypothetical protein